MRKLWIIPLLLVFISVANAQADLNAKAIDHVRLDIVQSGTLLVTGFTNYANLSYYIPQEGVTNVRVTADGDMKWGYTFDGFNNRMILIEWTKISGLINYRIEMDIENSAKHTSTEKGIGTNDLYLKETKYIIISDEIRQAAFPYEKSMKKAADLTEFVYNYLTYDLSYVGKNLPSDKVMLEKRGVCVEHANLLTALLRANRIPTRYIVGYAYSSVQEKFVGHTWVEILAGDGTWIPLDPTWLEGGYLDAAHVKSAALLDNSQIDTLTYLGGDIKWTRNEEDIRLIDYTEKPVTSIAVSGTDRLSSGTYGYVKAVVSANECVITDLTANSCVNQAGTKQFIIEDSNINTWMCGTKDVYWLFKTTGNNYICPISVYDQTGGQTEFRVTVQGGQSDSTGIFVSGPDTVSVGETFTLTASTNGFFYSPDFGVASGKDFTLNIKKSGTYNFYLYYFGSLYKKTVNVVDVKEFEIFIEAPTQAKIGSTFTANVTVKNLLERRTADIEIKYTNQTIRSSVILEKNGEKKFNLAFTANTAGQNVLVATAAGQSITSQSAVITTGKESGWLDRIIGFFSGLIDGIRRLFS